MNRKQFSLIQLLAWTTFVAIWLSLLKWRGKEWPFIAGLGLWMILLYLDRRFSPRFSPWDAVTILATLILAGPFGALIVSALR